MLEHCFCWQNMNTSLGCVHTKNVPALFDPNKLGLGSMVRWFYANRGINPLTIRQTPLESRKPKACLIKSDRLEERGRNYTSPTNPNDEWRPSWWYWNTTKSVKNLNTGAFWLWESGKVDRCQASLFGGWNECVEVEPTRATDFPRCNVFMLDYMRF